MDVGCAAKAYEEIRAGVGTPRIDPVTGKSKVYKGHENRRWAGAIEYEVPSRKDTQNGFRMLVKVLSDGRVIMGYSLEHYSDIRPFPAPHFPDDGWK